MLRPLACAFAVVLLVSGCSDDSNKSSAPTDGEKGESTAPATPTIPPPTPYDPPKAFVLNGQFAKVAGGPTGSASAGESASGSPGESAGESPSGKPTVSDAARNFKPTAAMWKTLAMTTDHTGLHAQDIVDRGKGWSASAGDATIETYDASTPIPVKLGGADVIAVAFYQKVLGSGTTKAHNQIRFLWVKPEDGSVAATVDVNVTPALGEGELDTTLVPNFTAEAVDAASGQMAIGLAPVSLIGAKSGIFTVFADPTAKTSTTVPFLEPAGVKNGIVVGAMGKSRTNRTVTGYDTATKTVKFTKNKEARVEPAGYGADHAYLSAQTYVGGKHHTYVYAVNISTGAVVATESTLKSPGYLRYFVCQNDSVSAVVCTHEEGEIVGIDDASGRKLWGYAEESGGRVVPKVSAVWHGMVYGSTDDGLARLDAKTGTDVPIPTPTPSGSTQSPGEGGSSESPGEGSTESPSGETSESPGESPTPTRRYGEEEDLPEADELRPTAVSEYGGMMLGEKKYSGGQSKIPIYILKAVG